MIKRQSPVRRLRARAGVARRRLTGLQREVERNIRVKVPRRSHEPGSVWGVSMVRNEADIIGATIEHLLGQGLAGIVVADNGSADSTSDILHDLARRDSRVHVGTDSLTGHYQGEKMSYLAHLARRGGADWVIPFDADEHWFAPNGSLADWLPTVEASVVQCAIRDAGPLPGQTALDLGRYLLDPEPTSLPKVAFRSRDWVWIAAGNHSCSVTGPRASGLELRHFQYRSFAQFERKVVQGAQAVEAARALPAGTAGHWKRIAAMSTDERWQEWVRLCDRPDRVLVER